MFLHLHGSGQSGNDVLHQTNWTLGDPSSKKLVAAHTCHQTGLLYPIDFNFFFRRDLPFPISPHKRALFLLFAGGDSRDRYFATSFEMLPRLGYR